MGREYAQAQGYQIVTELKEDDRGASGADWDLPQLNRALDMARAGEFDVLIVRELDRFARKLAKQLVVEAEFERAGVEIEYILAQYEDSPEGQLTKHVRAIIAEYEREKIKERMHRGKRNKIKAGHVVAAGHVCYGYRRAVVDGKQSLAIHEKEAAVIQMIFDLYTGDQRMGMVGISRKLTEMHVPTYGAIHRGKTTPRKKADHKWSVTAVNWILSNETYAGVWRWADLEVKVPAIISRAQWKAVQERKTENRIRAKRNRKERYLLSGHLQCGCCKASVIGRKSISKSKGKTYKYLHYRCAYQEDPRHYAKRECTNKKYYPVDLVDRLVWERIKAWLVDLEMFKAGLEAYKVEQHAKNEPLLTRLAIIRRQMDTYQDRLDALVEMRLDGDINKEDFRARKRQFEKISQDFEAEREAIEAKIREEELTQEQINLVLDYRHEIVAKLESVEASFEHKRTFLDILKTKVVLVMEDDIPVAYVYCIMGEACLPIVTSPSADTLALETRAVEGLRHARQPAERLVRYLRCCTRSVCDPCPSILSRFPDSPVRQRRLPQKRWRRYRGTLVCTLE